MPNILVNVVRTLLSEEGNIMLKRLILTALTIGVIAMLTLPTIASLVPMSWGFPTMVQNNSLTSFQAMFQNSTNFQTANIAFPDTTTGVLAESFPTIEQDGNSQNTLSQISFQQQKQYSQFAYPWFSMGFSPVPSMGFG